MKRVLFAVIIVSLLVGLAMFIPNNPSTAYPIPTSKPPVYVGPIWFGIYCDFTGAGDGYIRVKWDSESFPYGWGIDPDDPGTVTIFYPPSNYTYRTLLIVENGITKIWGTTWYPLQNQVADISGYVRLKQIGGGGSGYYNIQPSHVFQYCPEPLIYLPYVTK